MPQPAPPAPFVTTDWLAAHLDDPNLQIIDASWYLPTQNRSGRDEYSQGHIPGAIWGVRSRLAALQSQLSAAAHIVLTCPDGLLARLAVPELRGLASVEIHVLDGGTDAWHAYGRPLVKDRTNPADEACIDFYLRPYDRNTGVEEAMNAYLTWEIDLVHEIARDPTIAFGVPGETHAAA